MWTKAQIWRLQGNPSKHRPDLIVWPETVEEISAIVRACQKFSVPIIPYGAGSGVCGGTTPTRGGLILDLKRLNRVLAVDHDGYTVHAEAGVIGEVLERTVNRVGCTVGHFPSSIYCSTVGGWISTRSAGQYSSRYGKIEDIVLGVRFVDGMGRVWDTRNSPEGIRSLNLLPLITGSEGILGVITDAHLRMHPQPQTAGFRGIEVPDIQTGLELVRILGQMNHRPLLVRLYDPLDTAVCGLDKSEATDGNLVQGIQSLIGRLSSKLGFMAQEKMDDLGSSMQAFGLTYPSVSNRVTRLIRESCLLVFGFDGDEEGVARSMRYALQQADKLECIDLGEAPGITWLQTRHDASFRQSSVYALGGFIDTMEVATTYDNLYRLYDRVMRATAPYAVTMAHFSHAYREGCSIYFTFGARHRNPTQLEDLYRRVWRMAMNTVIENGGTLSHHHGIGLLKRDRMRDELGAGVDAIRALKEALDPNQIFNPGKLIP
tara:strand:+ start:275 stop:1738 length:1464 start_codon:yes stop_codon:yes gene_type:complete